MQEYARICKMDDIPQFRPRYHGNRPASSVTVPGEVVADLQPWRSCTNFVVEESCEEKQKTFTQLHWQEMNSQNSQGSSCLLEINVWVLQWYISPNLLRYQPFQHAPSPNLWLGRNPTTCGHSSIKRRPAIFPGLWASLGLSAKLVKSNESSSSAWIFSLNWTSWTYQTPECKNQVYNFFCI